MMKAVGCNRKFTFTYTCYYVLLLLAILSSKVSARDENNEWEKSQEDYAANPTDRIRLTPTGRLECTADGAAAAGDGCSFPNKKSLHFLVIGDTGGLPIFPYYSYAQNKIAHAMAKVARKKPLDFVVNVGDNFYFNGVENVFDSRFEDSFEEIYDYPELLVPWYLVAGNHDHLGNITAQQDYTNFSSKWTYPNLFYKMRFSFDSSSENSSTPVVLEILMLDTIVLCGNTVDIQGDSLFSWFFSKKLEPNGPPPKYKELAEQQWQWIERELAQSSADYLMVVGHYPVKSTCEHGGFSCLERLDSLLHAHGVNVYFSGHDHNLQHIRMAAKEGNPPVNYIVSGAASRTDRSAKHIDDVPREALLFRYPTGWNPISQMGFSNGGFVQARLRRDAGKIDFYNGKHELKYAFQLKPRVNKKK